MVSQTLSQAKRMEAPRAVALCRCFGGFLSFERGRWDLAETELQEAVALYRNMRSASGEALSLQRLGVLLTARGKLEDGFAVLNDGILAAERAVMRSHCLTRLYASMARNRLAARDTETSEAFIRKGEAASERHGHCLTCNALLRPEAVRVKLATGNLSGADADARRLEETARRFGSPAWSAMAHHARARVLSHTGDFERARARFEEAGVLFGEMGATYDAGRCLLGEVRALRAMGEAAKAETLYEAAVRKLDALGASFLED